MKELLSPKQVAASIGVSESSLKRWCDQGVINTERTPGGHRRIRTREMIRFLRERKHPIVRPEVLGLPTGTGLGARSLAKTHDALMLALTDGDAEQCRRLVIDLFLSGSSVERICEELVAPALHEIGEGWECGQIEVFQEHRASELLGRVLYELRSLLQPPERSAPVAIGGTPPGDNYRLATLMVELVLVDQGWDARSLGCSLPFETMAYAVQHHEPQVFWLSFSHVEDQMEARREFTRFLKATPRSMQVLVGGQNVDSWLIDLADGERVHFCDGLTSLRKTVSGISPQEGGQFAD